MRIQVTAVAKPGEHGVFALYKGGGRSVVAKTDGGLDLGRHLRPDEPEPDSVHADGRLSTA